MTKVYLDTENCLGYDPDSAGEYAVEHVLFQFYPDFNEVTINTHCGADSPLNKDQVKQLIEKLQGFVDRMKD